MSKPTTKSNQFNKPKKRQDYESWKKSRNIATKEAKPQLVVDGDVLLTERTLLKTKKKTQVDLIADFEKEAATMPTQQDVKESPQQKEKKRKKLEKKSSDFY